MVPLDARFLVLGLVSLLGACTSEPLDACASLKALDPAKAVADAGADARNGDAKFLAVYGRHTIETPGLPGANESSSIRILGVSKDGPCADDYERAVSYARGYNMALASLKSGRP